MKYKMRSAIFCLSLCLGFSLQLTTISNANALLGDNADDIYLVPNSWMASSERELAKLEKKAANTNAVKTNDQSFFSFPSLFSRKKPKDEVEVKEVTTTEKLEEGLDKLYDSKLTMLDEIKKDDSKKWGISSIFTEIAVEPGGSIGLLGMSGEAAIEFFWIPNTGVNPNPEVKDIPNANAANLDYEEGRGAPTAMALDPEMTEQELIDQMGPVIEAAIRSKKVTNKSRLTQTLLGKAKNLQKFAHTIMTNSSLREHSWFPYQLQMDVVVEATGMVAPAISIGAKTRFRFQWRRIEPIVPETAPQTAAAASSSISENESHEKGLFPTFTQDKFSTLLNNISEDLAVLDGVSFDDIFYNPEVIKFGIGFGVEGDVFVAEIKANASINVFFTRHFHHKLPTPVPTPAISLKSENTSILIEAKNTLSNLKLAEKLNLDAIPASSEKGHDPISSVYKIGRKQFRKALVKSLSIAKFFAQKATSHELKDRAMNKKRAFILNTIGVELNLTLTGGVGIVDLSQTSYFEMYLIRRPVQH